MNLRWPLTQHMLMSNVRLYPRITVSNSHGNTTKYVDTVTIFQKLQDGLWLQDDLSPYFYWGHIFDSTQGSLYPSPWKYVQVCGYSESGPPQKNNQKKPLNQRLLIPRWPLTKSVEVTCVTLPKDQCVQVPWKYIKVYGDSDLPFFTNLNQRSLTLDDLWPHVYCSHMRDST